MVRFDVGVESFLSQEIPKLFEFDHRLIVELPIGRSLPDIASHGLPIPYEKLALALLMSESDIYVLPPPHGSTENHFHLLANSSPSYGRPIGPREVWIYNHSTTKQSLDTSPAPPVSLFQYVHGNVCSFCYVEKFAEVLVREPARVSHLVDFNMLYVCRCWDFNKHLQCPTTVYLEDRDCVHYEQKPPLDHTRYKRKIQSLKSMIESVYTIGPAMNVAKPNRRRAKKPDSAPAVFSIQGVFGLSPSYKNATFDYICRLGFSPLMKLCRQQKVHPN